MNLRVPFSIAFMLLVPGPAGAETLDIKLGLWETTYTMETSGTPPMPPDVLKNMPPERRAKMEEMMKKRQAEGPRTRVHKSCVTKQTLERAFQPEDDKNQTCKRTIVSMSSRKQEMRGECTKEGRRNAMHAVVEATNSENVKGAFEINAADSARSMTVNEKFTSHWLGANCGNLKRD